MTRALTDRSMIVYLNGEYLPEEQACVPTTDRGFIFGDGIYEVVRAVEGRFFAWNAHLSRMREGLDGIYITTNDFDEGEIREVSERLLDRNELAEGHVNVYIQVTRGCAPRSHSFPSDTTQPTTFVCATPFDTPLELRKRGAAAILHPDVRWTRCDLKTVNLLPNILAKQKAVEAGAFEAILVRQGVITEGASTNVFAVSDGVLRTYPASNFILAGVTRSVVCDLARDAGIPVEEKPILWEEVFEVDELFLTGTTTDVQPVVELDGRRIAEGRPGPVTRRLQEMLREAMETPITIAAG